MDGCGDHGKCTGNPLPEHDFTYHHRSSIKRPTIKVAATHGMNRASTLITILILSGTALLLLSLRSHRHVSDMLADSLTARGHVTGLAPAGSSYAPVVRFEDSNGAQVEFTSPNSGGPMDYDPGEEVEVIYARKNPKKARINTPYEIWGGTIISAGMGSAFLLGGCAMLIAGMRRNRLADYLLRHGTPVHAEFYSIAIDDRHTVMGKSARKVIACWKDPSTARLHIFKSDNLWFHPVGLTKGQPITVYLDKRNPRKYHVDLSFLARGR
jgi:hypothetical protein